MIRRCQHIIFYLGVLLIPFFINSQEDLTSTEGYLVEQQQINFQTFFFEALQQKAIGNYDKAIFALDACYEINSENVAVLFELSKNYSFSHKYKEAKFFVLKALEFEPTNIYLLRFLQQIYLKQNDFKGAIKIKNKILLQKPDEESDLVILFIKSGEIDKAILLLEKLDSLDKLPNQLIVLKQSLTQSVIPEREEKKIGISKTKTKLEELKESYNLKNDFNSLKLVLERELKTERYLELLKDSEEGIQLYPAQPYIYLMNGVALNSLRKYKDAIEKLELGLEYLIDNTVMESQFMEQLSLSHKGLGQNKIATSYYKKALDLRKKD